MSSLRLSRVAAIDTALKLVAVAVAMFAFVFVVMVPLYNVLCDALGINGKTSSQAYTAIPATVDESRKVTVTSGAGGAFSCHKKAAQEGRQKSRGDPHHPA